MNETVWGTGQKWHETWKAAGAKGNIGSMAPTALVSKRMNESGCRACCTARSFMALAPCKVH